jgi:hypothetical protein
VDLKCVVSALNRALPAGITITEARIIPDGVKGPSVRADEFQLDVTLPGDRGLDDLRQAVRSVLSRDSIPWERKSEKSAKRIDLRPGIEALDVTGTTADGAAGVRMVLPHRQFTVRPSEVIELIRQMIPGVEMKSLHRADLLLEERPALIIEQKTARKGGDTVCQKR